MRSFPRTVDYKCCTCLRCNLYIQAAAIFLARLADLDKFLFRVSVPGFLLYWVVCCAILWVRSGRPGVVALIVIKWGSFVVFAFMIAVAAVSSW